MSHRPRIIILLVALLTFGAAANSQTPPAKTAPQKQTKTDKTARPAARDRAEEAAADERRNSVVMLAASLADEARSFRDEQLRARVQMRAADALWETDQERARALFQRAWEAADSAEREALRRLEEGGRDLRESNAEMPELRSEVLRLASRRDRALGEEFLAKMTEANERESQNLTINMDNSGPRPTPDPENPPADIKHRLLLARGFLEEGNVERALQFADKALDRVTVRGINFLSRLREKGQGAAADKRFAALFQRAAADPSSDATTVSVLSSYAFTPFLTIIIRGNGENHSMMESENIVAPNMPPQLRAAFLRSAAQILLRPVAPAGQDRTLAGRPGLYFVIARLLPLYDRYAPNLSAELRAQANALAPDAPEHLRTGQNPELTRGLVPEEEMPNEGQAALERADRAADPAERDFAYARAALDVAHKGDLSARDLLDKIENTETRKGARAYVDFTLVNQMMRKNDLQEALRLARAGELSHIQRAWALTEIAGAMKKTDAKNAAEVLDEAAAEARRIGGGDPDRARALFGVATHMYEIDRNRAWEIAGEAVKAGNSAEGFTGGDAQVVSRFKMQNGSMTMNLGVDSFDVHGIFARLAADDLIRAVELAKSFTGEAPRATATLAIVRSVLDVKRKPPANEKQATK
ncbi:MAG TPA: hypothetical protein VN256_17180 [Pyrinomonadaceae bacterium]|nr:hypothetical protein [Pyrinomonadaceae bacterium]